jgi:simple sugar transport system permease protein
MNPIPSLRFVRRINALRGASAVLVPLATVVLAFLMGGVVVFATQHGGVGSRVHNTLVAYHQILDGAGINWLGHFFRHPCLGFIPCHVPSTNLTLGHGFDSSAFNFSQTLLTTTTLILTGLAVAFAFRCGMFNIGGQGQYIVGLIVANWVGVDLAGMSTLPHVLIAICAATAAGAVWAGIAGVLKATVGAHEVISTIMLNWIAFWGASWLVGTGGPLQNPATPFNPKSSDVAMSARIPAFWGTPNFQALDYGFFIAIGALIAFWLVLNRTTLGYEVRAVGFNPDAAAYGGINVKKNIIRAMAISGAFAGLAGAVDMLGYLYHVGYPDIPFIQVGFLGIAVALLGRNTAAGVFFSALLFGGLLYGTTLGLTLVPNPVIEVANASNLTWIIEGFVVLFVSAPIVILSFWNLRKKVRPPAKAARAAGTTEAAA